MKRKILLLAAAIACMASVAFAEGYTPSITLDGMYGVQIEFVDGNADAAQEGVYLLPVTQAIASDVASAPLDEIDLNNVAEGFRELYEVRNEEIKTVLAAESIDVYFGESVNFEEHLGTSEYHLDELIPIVAGGFTEQAGAVKAKILFTTPYRKDQKVIVMIGIIIGVNPDGTRIIEWKPYTGTGMGDVDGTPELSGALEIELDNEILQQIQNNDALLAVVSA